MRMSQRRFDIFMVSLAEYTSTKIAMEKRKDQLGGKHYIGDKEFTRLQHIMRALEETRFQRIFNVTRDYSDEELHVDDYGFPNQL